MRISHFIKIAIVLFLVSDAWSQKATEMFIPIGKSPGVSGEMAIVATVQQFDSTAKKLTVTDSTETYQILLDDSTRIWLDRSNSKSKNTYGSKGDLKSGAVIEVKFRDPVGRNRADWVKVKME